MASRLRGIVLLVRDAEAAARFWSGGLGLPMLHRGPAAAELGAGAGVIMSVQEVDAGNEAVLSTGYSPLLTFEVASMDAKIHELVRLGGKLDGAIEYLPTGKVASMRSPDGHMLGLHEPA